MKRRIPPAAALVLAVALCAAVSVVAGAQQAPGEDPPFMQELFPPDLVMREGRNLGLADEQRAAITRAVQETEARVIELRWEMVDASQALAESLRGDRVEEEAAIGHLTKVLETEGRVKREHIRMLIRIKNQLTPEQQTRLREVRRR